MTFIKSLILWNFLLKSFLLGSLVNFQLPMAVCFHQPVFDRPLVLVSHGCTVPWFLCALSCFISFFLTAVSECWGHFMHWNSQILLWASVSFAHMLFHCGLPFSVASAAIWEHEPQPKSLLAFPRGGVDLICPLFPCAPSSFWLYCAASLSLGLETLVLSHTYFSPSPRSISALHILDL